MSAPVGTLDPNVAAPSGGEAPASSFDAAHGVPEFLASASRLAKGQVEIWFKQAGGALIRFAFVLALLAGGGVFFALSVIYLLISVFRMLTDLLHIAPAWAFMIFAGIHLLAAAVCMLGTRVFRKPATRCVPELHPIGNDP